MYKLFVLSSDSKWVMLNADWKLGEVMTFAVHWFRNREQLGDYRLDKFKVTSGQYLTDDKEKVCIYFTLTTSLEVTQWNT